jgi:hypothetical protein
LWALCSKPTPKSTGLEGTKRENGSVQSNDTGQRHELLIPNTIHVPLGSIPFCLLSPQHFGQENFKRGIDTHSKGTLNLTSGIDNWLSWGNLKYSVTTQLMRGSNVTLINSETVYSRFSAFVDLVDPDDAPLDLFWPHLIPDDSEPYHERVGQAVTSHLLIRQQATPNFLRSLTLSTRMTHLQTCFGHI